MRSRVLTLVLAGLVCAADPAAGASPRPLVAVLDTGADLGHRALRGALWTNPGEVPGNHIDDDRNGYVDDVHGIDALMHSGDPRDDHGHGTHVAGVVLAHASARILPIKVLDAANRGDTAALAEGIRYALRAGAQILSVSLNADRATPRLDAAIAELGAAGATLVAAAGNDARDLDVRPSFPASYAADAVLAVGSATPSGAFSRFSSRGARTLDLLAPGERVLGLALGGGRLRMTGTSAAAPRVAAALARMAAARPDLEQPRLRSELLAATRGGVLDVAVAMRRVSPVPSRTRGKATRKHPRVQRASRR